MATKQIDVVAMELADAIGSLVRYARAAAPQGLSWSEMAVLKSLMQGSMTTADLARSQRMRPQSMGSIVFGLEKVGLVARKPHKTDRRQYLIELTEKGAAVRKNQMTVKLSWLAKHIAKLEKHEQEILLRSAHLLKQFVEP